jgi:hypothetical protein
MVLVTVLGKSVREPIQKPVQEPVHKPVEMSSVQELVQELVQKCSRGLRGNSAENVFGGPRFARCAT